MLCRHCLKTKANRPRGLCWDCYYRPGVRELYPSTSKFAVRGLGHGYGSTPAVFPTDAAPGTEAKIAVLSKRAENGEALFHPDDAVVLKPGAFDVRRSRAPDHDRRRGRTEARRRSA